MEGHEAHQTLMYAFWSYIFMEMLRTHSIAVRELKYLLHALNPVDESTCKSMDIYG